MLCAAPLNTNYLSSRICTGLPRGLRKSARLVGVRKPGAWKELRFHQEYEFNLAEYIVELKQPLGITLAPDLEGNIYVTKVHKGSHADLSRVVKKGDILKKCTAAWGDSLMDCTDLRHAQWAILNRKQKVKLLLEHREESSQPGARWHRQGQAGQASSAMNALLRPLQFTKDGFQELETSGRGKCIVVSFRKTIFLESEQRQRASVRAERAAALRANLMAALNLPPYNLSDPQVPVYEPDDQTAGLNEVHLQESSNLVPYRRAIPGSINGKIEHNGNSSYIRGKSAQAKLVIPVLPWLLVSNTQLSQANLVDLAGKCGLQCLLEMQLEPCKGGLAMVRSCWRNTSVDAFVAAVGALHRLMRRREVIHKKCENGCTQCSVLLHCDSGMEGPTVGLIAAYCYLYGSMGYEESIQLAELALQARVPRDLLKEVTDYLEEQAIERNTGVTVAWHYGGAKVEITGDLVGGWKKRFSLRKCPSNPSPCQSTPQGTHFLRLQGLEPGVYNYKFIVDGAWQVDFLGPTAMDKSGNWNNVLLVDSNDSCFEDKATEDLIRMEAALVALRSKRRIV